MERSWSRLGQDTRSHAIDMIRLGLCCIFRDEPVKFRTTTAAAVKKLGRHERLAKLSDICLSNAHVLLEALQYCSGHGIGCFRINSQILPIKTHPEFGYDLGDLPGGEQIVDQFRRCGEFARANGLRTTFHPDQFVVLNSPKPEVVEHSIAELAYQAEVAEWVEADVINIHAGGVYGNRSSALEQLRRGIDRLSDKVRQRLTLENDEKCYSPADLLTFCTSVGIPLVYDVHHHRCNPDGVSVEEVTNQAIATWNREPLFHISSPLEGWKGPKPSRHHDFINVRDFPQCWYNLDVTVEIEAKAKEAAIQRLRTALEKKGGKVE
jgi:UV DNA damage endonuclease